MIFDHYWKKRALKAEKELRRARGDAACEKALREDQKDRVQQMSERDTYQSIAIETLQEENRNLRRQHRRDQELQDALAKEIEEKNETVETLRGILEMMKANNARLWGMVRQEPELTVDQAKALELLIKGESALTAPLEESREREDSGPGVPISDRRYGEHPQQGSRERADDIRPYEEETV